MSFIVTHICNGIIAWVAEVSGILKPEQLSPKQVLIFHQKYPQTIKDLAPLYVCDTLMIMLSLSKCHVKLHSFIISRPRDYGEVFALQR